MSLIASLALVAAAAALTPPEEAIVVTGTRTIPQIAQAIRRVAATPVEDQIARWRAPVCVGVVGLSKPIAARVIDRVEAGARDAEIRLARRPCKANAFVVFTASGTALTKVFAKKSPRLFATMDRGAYQSLLAPNLPVRWWYGYEATGADGRPLVDSGTAAIGANASSTEGINLPSRVSSSYSETLVGTKFNVDVIAAIVIVDVTLANGISLDAVADYAGRVILGPTRLPVAASDQPTILKLFAGAKDTPDRLTRFDRAYLWALYRLPAERSAWAQRGKMATLVANRMAQE